jgi:hypothetical protein
VPAHTPSSHVSFDAHKLPSLQATPRFKASHTPSNSDPAAMLQAMQSVVLSPQASLQQSPSEQTPLAHESGPAVHGSPLRSLHVPVASHVSMLTHVPGSIWFVTGMQAPAFGPHDMQVPRHG